MRTILFVSVLFILGLLLAVGISKFDLRHGSDQIDAPTENIAPAAVAQRIICLSPAITEIVFALDAVDHIIATSGFCRYPPEAVSYPQVGSYINPNFERIVSLQPDLIIYQGKFEKMARFCLIRTIPALNVKLDTVDDIYQTIRQIGSQLDRNRKADNLCHNIQSDIKQIQERLSGKETVPVFISMFRQPDALVNLATVGPDTVISSLIETAGGRNIFHDVTTLYPTISKESLIKRRPQVIIEIQSPDFVADHTPDELIDSWRMLADLPAVQNRRVFVVTDSSLFTHGPRIAQATRILAELIHPEAFDD